MHVLSYKQTILLFFCSFVFKIVIPNLRSLVLARDDVSRALCCFSGFMLSETDNIRIILNAVTIAYQPSFLAGTRNIMVMIGAYPCQHCTAHEDKVPGPCQG